MVKKKNNKKKRQNEIEMITAEETFGFDFIAGFTPGGVPYGMTMDEGEDQSLLEDDDDMLSDLDLPF